LGGTRSLRCARRFEEFAGFKSARASQWKMGASRCATLVPGDIVRLYLGDVVPADCRLIQGDYISIDQSALTGESLPVTKKSGEGAYSGSVVKQGEMVAVVTATGSNTFFGRTAKLVAGDWEFPPGWPAGRRTNRRSPRPCDVSSRKNRPPLMWQWYIAKLPPAF